MTLHTGISNCHNNNRKKLDGTLLNQLTIALSSAPAQQCPTPAIGSHQLNETFSPVHSTKAPKKYKHPHHFS